MPKYTCERCLKDFSQKSHYNKHQNNKRSCQDKKSKKEEVVESIIKNKKLISNINENNNTNSISMELVELDSQPDEVSNEIFNEDTNDFYEHDEEYMRKYLDTIRKKDGTYKRVLISPLRYAGGKSKAIGLILNSLPKLRNKRIVSPFFGGGSFELCVSQILDIEVIGYDIFGMLTNFWNVLINHKDEFIEELKKFKITPEEFTYNRHVLLNYWGKN